MSVSEQVFLTPDFAATVEYKPRVAALEAENKVLKELLRKVVSYPRIAEFVEDTDPKVFAWWLASELGNMSRLLYNLSQAFEKGDDMKELMSDVNEILSELDFDGEIGEDD